MKGNAANEQYSRTEHQNSCYKPGMNNFNDDKGHKCYKYEDGGAHWGLGQQVWGRISETEETVSISV